MSTSQEEEKNLAEFKIFRSDIDFNSVWKTENSAALSVREADLGDDYNDEDDPARKSQFQNSDWVDFADMGTMSLDTKQELDAGSSYNINSYRSNFPNMPAENDIDGTASKSYIDSISNEVDSSTIGLYHQIPDFDEAAHSEDEEEVKKNPNEIYVVGIGASAGGLDAIKCFFSSLNASQEELSRIAFVVIQHISISYKSMMLEILSSQVHDIKMLEVEQGMKIEPKSIYFIPSKFSMTIRDRIFQLHPRKDDSPGFLPIDKFFTSLAENFGQNSIGVILSGTGKDGTEGIKSIHKSRGVVLVQNEESAEFDGMPKSAIETNVVDSVMYPEDMMCFIFDLVGNRSTQTGEESDVSVYQLLRLVESDVDIDFSFYKYPTMKRRVSRRMKENNCNSLKEYRDILIVNKVERLKLVDSVLIDVTSFFRGDFAFFENHLIPQIVEMVRPSEIIRIWVPACSTGEEAYTIAMLFLEYKEISNKPFNVKVFATDVKSICLRVAQKGEYPHTIEKYVSAKRLSRFFTKTKTVYRAKSDLRNTIVFVKHNIVTNNPFINLHLISCRNCLIYMKVEAQKIALQSFHFGLMDGGFLTLGSSESVHKSITGFTIFNRKFNVYRKANRQRLNDFSALPFIKSKPSKPSDLLSNLSKEMILYHYPYPFLIVDGDWTLIYANELAKRFISLSLGTVITNVCDMVVSALKIPLKSAILRAKTRAENVSVTSISIDNEICDLDTLVLNLDDLIVYAVVIKPRDADKHSNGAVLADQSSILFLQEELQKTKQELQHTMEQLETSNEELQSSNEELQSSNEELQSTNEELRCINREFQDKIRLLNEINNDMNHLIWSINIGIMFLGRDLRIRKFTPAITPLISLRESDIGRSITDLVFKGSNNVIALIEQVVSSGTKRETTVIISTRIWSVRILPYVTNSEVNGVIVTSYERYVFDEDTSNSSEASGESLEKQAELDEKIKDLLKPKLKPQSLTFTEQQNLNNPTYWSDPNSWLLSKSAMIKTVISYLENILYSGDSIKQEALAVALDAILNITSSEFGYIAEHKRDEESKRQKLVMRVITNISWDQKSQIAFKSSLRSGLEFKSGANLLTAVIDSQQVVIANENIANQTPSGHPKMSSYMAIPLFLDDLMIGSIGISNRPHGYNIGVFEGLKELFKLVSKCLIRYSMNLGDGAHSGGKHISAASLWK
jgi:chemotaxis methyl-accepting protein methylase/chemotaxis response regulator CheB